MSDGVVESPEGGFACLPFASRAFSLGVIALPAHALRRIQLRVALPMEEGLRFAAEFIRGAGRPVEAFCACELRMPERLGIAEFAQFNKRYVAALRAGGFVTDPANPAARTNMAPAMDPPADAVLHAFTFAAPASDMDGADYVISGMPEFDPPRVIAPGDVSREGMRTKAAFVVESLRKTVEVLGGEWGRATAMQVYTMRPVEDVADLLPATAMTHVPGVPPLCGPEGVPFEFEADVRAVSYEEMV